MYDILIKNGTIVDGTGGPGFLGDVAIHNDEIVAIGRVHGSEAAQVIDATGKIIAPGFIDINNHSDVFWQIFYHPELQSMLAQGVTTIIGGNAGASLAPLVDRKNIRAIQKWVDVERLAFNWLSMEDFLAAVRHKGLAVNFGTLVGHGTMRRGVLEDQTRTVTPSEVHIMQDMLDSALRQGALGLSSGLQYTHARTAAAREMVALAKATRQQKGIYTTNLRDERSGLLEAVDEALYVKQSKIPVHISHFKALGEKNWPLFEKALEKVSSAALDGTKITFDVYPYTEASSVLYTLLPEWVTRQGRIMMLAQFKDVGVRAQVIADMQNDKRDFSQVVIASSRINKTLVRKKVGDIAQEQGVTAEEAVIRILEASEGRVLATYEAMSPLNVEKALKSPYSLISSNGAGYSREHIKTGDVVHPRNFGTFPRVLGTYARQKELLSLEEAIHKMTGKPRETLGLTDRGLLKKGQKADVVVFDFKIIDDVATLENPYQFPRGIDYVVVNGVVSYSQGKFSSERSGQVITEKRSGFGSNHMHTKQ